MRERELLVEDFLREVPLIGFAHHSDEKTKL